MSMFTERDSDDLRPWSFVIHDRRHDQLVGKAPKAPETPTPGDVENRLDDQERRRLQGGGRNATNLSALAAPASSGARPTLTGLG